MPKQMVIDFKQYCPAQRLGCNALHAYVASFDAAQCWIISKYSNSLSPYAGYIMDRRVGNTKKMGALFGILAAIGGPIPEPETIPYAFFILSNRLSSIFQSK